MDGDGVPVLSRLHYPRWPVSFLWWRCVKSVPTVSQHGPKDLLSAALSQTGHGGAGEDGPAGLAERDAVRVPDIQVL